MSLTGMSACAHTAHAESTIEPHIVYARVDAMGRAGAVVGHMRILSVGWAAIYLAYQPAALLGGGLGKAAAMGLALPSMLPWNHNLAHQQQWVWPAP